jgi:hypothetical protein
MSRHFKTLIVIISILLWSQGFNYSQVTTNGGLTPTQLVNNVLLGGGITASNITYTGYANGISEFTIGAPLGWLEGFI